MLYQQVLKNVVFGCKLAVVTLAIIALGIAGASAAERLVAAANDPGVVTEIAPDQVELVASADSEEEAGDMASGGRPCTEQVAILKASLHLPGSKDRCPTPGTRSLLQSEISRDSNSVCRYVPKTTHGSVCWRLNRLFTLVGAKPSGTS